MADFQVRSDAVDVEHIMRQIRQRISEKRGVDYTEEELKALAAVKLEKFLDPDGVRSDLVRQFRTLQARVPEPPSPNFAFEDTTLYDTHRGVLRFLRKLFRPFLKLLFNPDTIVSALHIQAELNRRNAEFRSEFTARQHTLQNLQYEVMHNLVVELTRAGIEIRNLKMRLDAMAGRLDFDERRHRAFEGVVQYRKPEGRPQGGRGGTGRGQDSPMPAAQVQAPAAQAAQAQTGTAAASGETEEGAQRSRRRRRRRRRVPPAGMPSGPGPASPSDQGSSGGGDAAGGEAPPE